LVTAAGRHRQRPAPSVGAGKQTGFRPDVQGLRAIAVGVVVFYHLYPKLLPGGYVGVDVFFVISGFLITSHLARGYRKTGRIKLLDFWGRRARRLLPAAALVLTVTWLASRVILPASRLPATAEQVRASALYFQNWVLARDAVNYLTAEDAPSPVQHFWSLSVEEQFYLLWPLLFAVAALVGLRWRRRLGQLTVFLLAAAVLIVSLGFSVHLTRTDPAAAYFVTTTRMWELAAGGLLALLPGRVTRVLDRQGWLAWIGLAMVASSTFVIKGTSAFPGTIALLPVGGAVLMIAGGSRLGRFGPWRLTSLAPMVFLGDISYSLYLWHWPLIVLWKDHSGGGIGYLDGPAIAAVAIVLAWLTKVLVEDRVRSARLIVRRPAFSIATVVVLAVPVGLVALYTPPGAYHPKYDAQHAGAAALAGASTSRSPSTATGTQSLASVEPPPAQAANDYEHFSNCQTPTEDVTPRPCLSGDKTNPTLRVALVGDSVAGQWHSDIETIAKEKHWLLLTDLHGLCPWTATLTAKEGTSTPNKNCQKWGSEITDVLLTQFHPDVVITSARPVLGTPSHSKVDATSFGQIAAGMATYWRQLEAAGAKVVPIRESPEPHFDVPDCLTSPGGSIQKCTVSKAKAVDPDTPIVQAVQMMKGSVDMVDMNSLICGQALCSPVIGDVVVYRDSHHLTLTYQRTLLPYLRSKLLTTKAFVP